MTALTDIPDPFIHDQDQEWLTRQQAAAYLNISPRWLASADGRGTVPYFKFGGQVRYCKTELDKWARAQRAA